MAYDGQSHFLSLLDEDTRIRYIKAKAAQGIDVTKPDPQVMAIPDLDPRYHPSYEASKALDRIYQAIEAENLQAVRSLVEDESYNPTPHYLSQALAKAIWSTRISIVQYLLDHGAGIDRGVVGAAAKAKSLAIFEMMVQAGWDVNSPKFRGHTVLPSLVQNEDLVEWFLRQGADPNLGSPRIDQSEESIPTTGSGECLYNAAASATPAVVELLINNGAKLENSTTLHAAIRRRWEESQPMLKYLLSLGADINGLADPCDQFSVGTPLESLIRHDILGIQGRRGDAFEQMKFLLASGANPRPDGRRGIDVLNEPVRSELQEIYDRSARLKQGEKEEQHSPASSVTLTDT